MGYTGPPWTFNGRAIYQLHLVKVDQAKQFIPEHLKIVSFFGYTLGGLYLARYSDSPAGAFDEVVVLAGLVWNFPTSCAWAARVYVNNWDARNHGRSAIGLPSCHASFQSAALPGDAAAPAPCRSWWTAMTGQSSATAPPQPCSVQLRNLERKRWWQRRPPAYAREEGTVCCMGLPPPSTGWQGPHLSLSLPSFSGATPMVPEVLQYACRLSTHVRPMKPIQIAAPEPMVEFAPDEDDERALHCILTGRPVFALAFSNMVMQVRQPVPLANQETELRKRVETPIPAFASMAG